MTAPASEWRDDDVPVPAADVCAAYLDGEGVLYSLEQARSVVLNASAAAVWARLDGRATVGEIAAEMADLRATDRQRVIDDLVASLSVMETLKVVSRILSD